MRGTTTAAGMFSVALVAFLGLAFTHRDVKPANVLVAPPTSASVAAPVTHSSARVLPMDLMPEEAPVASYGARGGDRKVSLEDWLTPGE